MPLLRWLDSGVCWGMVLCLMASVGCESTRLGPGDGHAGNPVRRAGSVTSAQLAADSAAKPPAEAARKRRRLVFIFAPHPCGNRVAAPDAMAWP